MALQDLHSVKKNNRLRQCKLPANFTGCMRLLLTLLFLFHFLLPAAKAQQINGVVVEGTGGVPIGYVSVENEFSGQGLITDSTGHFTITAAKGEVIAFRKLGYRTARLRVPQGAAPPFYKVVLQKGAFELQEVEVRDRYRNYKLDSVRNHELYKNALEFPTMSTVDAISHPFSALSKTNRNKWAFQKDYNYWESQKFIDYTFNENLITRLTGLKGDSLLRYQRAWRPTYEELREMKEYEFYEYIRKTAESWRRNPAYRRD